jgi:ankyrin repeat protein
VLKRFDKDDRDRFVAGARQGDLDVVQRYLSQGMWADALDRWNDTALVESAKGQNLPILKALLDAGANASLATKSITGNGFRRSAIHWATEKCNFAAIDLLLSNGADPRVLDGNSMTAAHVLLFEWPAMQSKPGSEELLLPALDRMLELGVPINQRDFYGRTLLGTAVTVGAPSSVLSWLIDRGADLNRVAERDQSALHVVVENGLNEAMHLLFVRGADVNAVDNAGRTPLFGTWGEEDIGQALLALGADLEHQDNNGQTPLSHSLAEAQSSRGLTKKSAFLIHVGANPDTPDFEGITALARAAARRQTDVVTLLNASTARRAMARAAERPAAMS